MEEKLTKRQLTNDELIQISRNADWQSGFVELGIKKDETKSKINDWWGWSPFNPNEKTASFHLNEKGYYCFSTQKGGNFVELVKNVLEFPTFTEAGYWCLEHNISSLKESIKSKDRSNLILHLYRMLLALTAWTELHSSSFARNLAAWQAHTLPQT